MKNLLFLLTISFLSQHTKSQVVFCPPGAEWSYNFFFSAGGFPGAQQTFLEKITYKRDSIVDNETVKVLEHHWFYLSCGVVNSIVTLIKQNGDTVFMRNRATNNNWQILYNFNMNAGQSWETEVRLDPNSSTDLSTKTYTIRVDSVKNIIENGQNLKLLYVKYQHYHPSQAFVTSSVTITERFGCNEFLFHYNNALEGGCDGDWFQTNLCYKDSQFGTKQFTNRPCDFQNLTGLIENENDNSISIYPNPASTHLILESKLPSQTLYFEIIDLLGKSIRKQYFDGAQTIDVSALQNGIYFLKVFDKNSLLATGKFVKK